MKKMTVLTVLILLTLFALIGMDLYQLKKAQASQPATSLGLTTRANR